MVRGMRVKYKNLISTVQNIPLLLSNNVHIDNCVIFLQDSNEKGLLFKLWNKIFPCVLLGRFSESSKSKLFLDSVYMF